MASGRLAFALLLLVTLVRVEAGALYALSQVERFRTWRTRLVADPAAATTFCAARARPDEPCHLEFFVAARGVSVGICSAASVSSSPRPPRLHVLRLICGFSAGAFSASLPLLEAQVFR